jgi:hypothetical protein
VADWLKLSEIKVSMRAKLMAKVAPEGNLTYEFRGPNSLHLNFHYRKYYYLKAVLSIR